MGGSCLPGGSCSGLASATGTCACPGVALPLLHPLSWFPNLACCSWHLRPVAQHLLYAECQGRKEFPLCQIVTCFCRHLRHGAQVGFAVLHLCQKAVEELVFGQICICTKDTTMKQQGEGLWANHHMSHEP